MCSLAGCRTVSSSGFNAVTVAHKIIDELDARLEQAGASGRERQQAQEEANARVTYERQQDDQAAQLDAVLERNRQWVRDEYGDDLTDEECDEILEEEFGDDE